MKSMLSRLFCSVMFLTAALGNIVMANEDYYSAKLETSIIATFGQCETFDDSCLEQFHNKADDKTASVILDTHFDKYRVYPDIHEWVITVAGYVQNLRLANSVYKEILYGTATGSSVDKAEFYKFYSGKTLMSEDLCGNLIQGYISSGTPFESYMTHEGISEQSKYDIMMKAFNIFRVCDYKYDENGKPDFDIKWNDPTLIEIVNEFTEELDNYR